jgi:two-component system phosphate regulon response regulator PhoB
MSNDPKKILIVEDDKSHTAAYRTTLEKNGYEVTTTDNAQDGLRLATEINPNIVILDVMLPGGKNGFEALKQIKENQQLQELPVFMITNLGDEHKIEALSLGATKYFVKTNISLDDLIKEIKEVI